MVITLSFGNLEFSSGCLGSFFYLFPVHLGKTNMATTNRYNSFIAFGSSKSCRIVLKISHLPSKLRFSAKCSFFGQSLSRGHYQPIDQPPEGVYLLNNEEPNSRGRKRHRFTNHGIATRHAMLRILIHASQKKYRGLSCRLRRTRNFGIGFWTVI